MRNFNTSSVKNAVCRFGQDANDVLFALTSPAARLLRLKQSIVRIIGAYALPASVRLGTEATMSGTTVGTATPTANIDRIWSMLLGEAALGQQGLGHGDCLAGQTVS